MKTRFGFVSNSSSSSFVLDTRTPEQIIADKAIYELKIKEKNIELLNKCKKLELTPYKITFKKYDFMWDDGWVFDYNYDNIYCIKNDKLNYEYIKKLEDSINDMYDMEVKIKVDSYEKLTND